MSARIEAWLWASGDASVFDATATLSITDAGGTDTFTLSGPALATDALSEWQTLINASGTLADTYTVGWLVSGESVAVEFDNDNSNNFTLAFAGNLHTVLGFSSASNTGADNYRSDEIPLVRFDAVRVSTQPPESGGDVNLREYAHGRARVIAFGAVDVFQFRVWVRAGHTAAFFASCCVAGKVRVYCDSSNGSAYAADNLSGYVDGYVLGCANQADTSGKTWTACDLTIGYPRA